MKMIARAVFLTVALGSSLADDASCSDRASLPSGVTEADITLPENAAPGAARRIFEKYGVLVVRGLMSSLAPRIRQAADAAFARSLEQLEAGQLETVQNEDTVVGWVTPDQTLFIPAPAGHVRELQAMVLALDYFQDATMLAAALDPRTLDLLEDMTAWRNIELFGKGQCFYKEGVANAQSAGGVSTNMMGQNAAAETSVAAAVAPGGNPKYLHQDSAYFMFGHDGAVASLSYAVNTSGALDNGPLYVVPGSHRLGHVAHRDTPSHLGVPSDEWSFDDALRIDGAAGDTVFFHIHTLHGSTPNRSPHARPTFINRYIEASDYQAYFATDALMRQKAKAEYEEAQRSGNLPPKERGVMVRGAREWKADGPAWKRDTRVNH